jgi:hypothetical protein
MGSKASIGYRRLVRAITGPSPSHITRPLDTVKRVYDASFGSRDIPIPLSLRQSITHFWRAKRDDHTILYSRDDYARAVIRKAVGLKPKQLQHHERHLSKVTRKLSPFGLCRDIGQQPGSSAV